MKIVFFEVKDWEKEYLCERFNGYELIFLHDELTPDNAHDYADADIISVFIYSIINDEVLSKMSNLKHIATRSTGFDHIDLEMCKKRKIIVSNVPFYGSNTVAEHTFALILALSRKIVESVEETKREDFSREGLIGFDLKGRTLGVVGTGQIGLHVIRIARGFQMKVLAFDVFPKEDKAAELGFSYAPLEELLSQSDIVSLHAPLNEHTKHMINSSNITLMKEGSMIINTSRGGLIDTEALLRALKEGRIAGAGLDVLEEETFVDEEISLLFDSPTERHRTIIANHMLLNMPGVLITPHNAFNSHEALIRILDTTVENIHAYIQNKPENQI